MAKPVEMPLPDGKKAMVIELSFQIANEDWNEYRLEGGIILRMKSTVARVFRVLDAEGNPAYHDSGEPNIVIQSTNTAIANEEE